MRYIVSEFATEDEELLGLEYDPHRPIPPKPEAEVQDEF